MLKGLSAAQSMMGLRREAATSSQLEICPPTEAPSLSAERGACC